MKVKTKDVLIGAVMSFLIYLVVSMVFSAITGLPFNWEARITPAIVYAIGFYAGAKFQSRIRQRN